MAYIPTPHKVKLELMSNEIETIIDELTRIPHNIYDFLNLNKIVDKLKIAVLTENNNPSESGARINDGGISK